jgi:periplasmic mercuric ion binding protein
MKNVVVTLILGILMIGAQSLFADNAQKTDTFKVYGKCGLCKARIEGAAKSIDGVAKADWNMKTEMLAVTYNPSKTNETSISKAIAKVGHDTQFDKADDSTYTGLPGCCKYDRATFPDKKK